MGDLHVGKRSTTLVMDENLLREAERVAGLRKKTLDELVEEALLREVETLSLAKVARVHLPTHGKGGLRPGVDLEDIDSIERLLAEP